MVFVSESVVSAKGGAGTLNSYQDLDGSASESAKNVLSFQRRSPPVQDRNLLIRSSGKEGNGSEGRFVEPVF